jgi:hypothetical protein
MAATYLRETVVELRAEAQAARTAEQIAEQRLHELRVAFRAFGEEALTKNPGASWSSQSMDTLFNLGLSIASVERAHDRASNHVERIVDQAARAEDAVSKVADAAQASAPDEPGQSPGEEPTHGGDDPRMDSA